MQKRILLLLAAVGMLFGQTEGQPSDRTTALQAQALQISDFAGQWILAPDLSQDLEGPLAHSRLLLSIDAGGEVTLTIQPPELKHHMKLEPDGRQTDFLPGFLPPSPMLPRPEGGAMLPPPGEFPPPLMFPPVCKRSMTWGEDQTTLVVLEKLTIPSSDGSLELCRRSVWSLNAERSLLTWNVEQDTPRGSHRSLQVFRKQT